MINLLVSLIVLCIIFGLIYWLFTMLPIPEPFVSVIRVCVILVFILLLLGIMFGGIYMPHMRGFR